MIDEELRVRFDEFYEEELQSWLVETGRELTAQSEIDFIQYLKRSGRVPLPDGSVATVSTLGEEGGDGLEDEEEIDLDAPPETGLSSLPNPVKIAIFAAITLLSVGIAVAPVIYMHKKNTETTEEATPTTEAVTQYVSIEDMRLPDTIDQALVSKHGQTYDLPVPRKVDLYDADGQLVESYFVFPVEVEAIVFPCEDEMRKAGLVLEVPTQEDEDDEAETLPPLQPDILCWASGTYVNYLFAAPYSPANEDALWAMKERGGRVVLRTATGRELTFLVHPEDVRPEPRNNATVFSQQYPKITIVLADRVLRGNERPCPSTATATEDGGDSGESENESGDENECYEIVDPSLRLVLQGEYDATEDIGEVNAQPEPSQPDYTQVRIGDKFRLVPASVNDASTGVDVAIVSGFIDAAHNLSSLTLRVAPQGENYAPQMMSVELVPGDYNAAVPVAPHSALNGESGFVLAGQTALVTYEAPLGGGTQGVWGWFIKASPSYLFVLPDGRAVDTLFVAPGL